MMTKFYLALFGTLIIGLFGGYFVGSFLQQAPDLGLDEQIVSLQSEVQRLETQVSAKDGQMAVLQTDVQNLTSQIASKNALVSSLQSENQNLNSQISSANGQISSLQTEVQNLNNQIVDKNQQITSLQTEIQDLNHQIGAKDAEIATLQAELGNIDDLINAKNAEIAALQIEVQDLNSQIDAKDAEITALQLEIEGLRVGVEVEVVVWNVAADTASVKLSNTGAVAVTVESIGLQEATPGAPWFRDFSVGATGNLNPGEVRVLVWDGASVGFDLQPATAYLIQIDYSSSYTAQYLGSTPST